MDIYLDVLLILNLYIDFVLIYACQKIINTKISFKRNLLAAAVGSMASLVILLPCNRLISLAVSVATAILISLTAFGRNIIIKASVVLYVMMCLFSGLSVLIWHLTGNSSIIINNNVVYYNISPLLLIISTLVFYGIICIYKRITVKFSATKNCRLHIDYESNSADLNCLIDTGNTLRDCISDLPVIIIDDCSSTNLVGIALNSNYCENGLIKGFRLIPCNSISSKELLPAFKPDKLTAFIDNKAYSINALVAVSSTKLKGIQAIIPSSAILNGEELFFA